MALKLYDDEGCPWNPVTKATAFATLSAVAVLFYLLARDDDGFLVLLDHANLAFHEAGHVLYGTFGQTLGLYGGTLGQLTVPVIVAVAFWRNREAPGFAVSGVWFFQNFLNIARYMADARAQQLPLVGGGEHDWTNIFSRWNLLSSDTLIASFVQSAGWLGMIASCLWLLWRWLESQRNPA